MADTDPPEDFASLLAAQGNSKPKRLHVGDKVHVKVVHIGKEDVFVAVSPTQEAVVAKADLQDAEGQLTVAVGDTFDGFVVSLGDSIVVSRKLGRDAIDVAALEEAKGSGLPVEGVVTGLNKGGLEVSLGGARGFCPLGQIALGFVDDPQAFVGKTLQFAVREVSNRGRNVVLSRRVLLEAEQREKAKELLATLAEGQRREGTVTRVLDFGVFVDLGGVEGLIPISELSFARVDKPSDVVAVGDVVSVDVMRIEPDPKRADRLRIALSLKAAQPDPWLTATGDLEEGMLLEGKVVRLEKFGAFVQVAPGVEGLLHVSEMSHKRVRHPGDLVQVGESITVRVLAVDREARRLSLSTKQESAQTAAANSTALSVGSTVEGTVERIERYGVFLALPGGQKALLPGAESGTPKGTDLGRVFPLGTVIAAQVIAIDERGRIKVSKVAAEQAEERAALDSYGKQAKGQGGLGTLGDLFNLKR